MENLLSQFINNFEKGIYFLQLDAFYILPIIGAFQIFLTGFYLKRQKIKYLGLFLFIILCIISPLIKLVPNLGSDAFSEFQKLNFEEVFFYIKTLNFFASWDIRHFILWFVTITIYSICILVLYFFFKKYGLRFVNINYFIIFALVSIPTFINIYQVSLLYKSSVDEKKKLEENFIYQLDSLNIKPNKSNDLSVILYIGEATTRLHWSIYNYLRPTNENLENFNKKNSIILYDNIYSTHTHTSPSLLDVLTLNAMDEKKNELKTIYQTKRYPLVDLLNKASVNTILYSTQAKSGSWNLTSSLIFKNANKKSYSSKYNLGNANYLDNKKPFDHEFLNNFTDELKKNQKLNNFFVFHSYAGHGNYKKNIPKNYRKKIDNFYTKYSDRAIFGNFFKSNQKSYLEGYDSAMSYVSDNIVIALENISKLKKPAVFIYTPDHGESPLTGRGHDSSRYTWEMTSVPFLIFFNDAAKKKYSKLYNKINSRSELNNREMLSNLPSLILEIFGLQVFNSDDEINSVSKCKFGEGNCFGNYHMVRKQLDNFGIVNLTYPYAKNKSYIDNTDRATTFANVHNYLYQKNSNLRICSHRTHTIARYIRFNEILNCMEMDITIDENNLDIRRPLDETNNLSLTDIVQVQKNKKNILWLDIKNVVNEEQCFKLNNILKNFSSEKNDFFLEFPTHIIDNYDQLSNCISDIKSLNFIMAYRIPSDIDEKCQIEKEFNYSNQKKCKYLNQLLKKINKSKLFTDISFDYKNYKILKDNDYLKEFFLNSWNIPDKIISSVDDKRFRLLIPYNDELNYY
jgi:glucan phosphoethanolaminetransferase (alkaline phosphatase superfamily)